MTTALVAILTALLGGGLGWALGSRRAEPALARAADAEHGRADAEAARTDAEARAAAADAARLALSGQQAQHQAWMQDQFKAVSGDALQAATRQLTELTQATLAAATTKADGDLAQRQLAVESLIAPIRDTLTRLDEEIRRSQEAQSATRARLSQFAETSESLRAQTHTLATALAKPQVRGAWGEMHLKQAVELAGMQERCDFDLQVTSPDGRGRVDLLVRLPGGGHIPVDSKVPLNAFTLAMAEGVDDATRARLLREHSGHLRGHVKELSTKAYWSAFTPAPDAVVLYVPNEAMLFAALDSDPTLFEDAARANVLLVGPTGLMGLLRAVAFGWRQDSFREDAQRVLESGRELYKRLSVLGKHVSTLGSRLTSSVTAFNGLVGSLETQVLPSARRFSKLAIAGDELPELKAIEEDARGVVAAELVDDEPERAVASTPLIAAVEPRRDRGERAIIEEIGEHASLTVGSADGDVSLFGSA